MDGVRLRGRTGNHDPRLEVVRSVSLYGLSDVTLTFRDGTDDYFARQQAFERLPGGPYPRALRAMWFH